LANRNIRCDFQFSSSRLMRLPFQQEEIWNIVTEQVRNSCTATSHSSPANQPVRMDNECICVAAKKP
jgi:hypothetical protein